MKQVVLVRRLKRKAPQGSGAMRAVQAAEHGKCKLAGKLLRRALRSGRGGLYTEDVAFPIVSRLCPNTNLNTNDASAIAHRRARKRR